MLLTEKEVRRIVSVHFEEKYEMDVNPDHMEWRQDNPIPVDIPIIGLEVGGAIIGKDG